MVNFKETFHFSRFERGSNIFQGSNFFQGVGGPIAYSLLKLKQLVTSQGGGGPDPLSPSGSALVHLKLDI